MWQCHAQVLFVNRQSATLYPSSGVSVACLTKCAAFRGRQRDVGVDERLALAYLSITGA